MSFLNKSVNYSQTTVLKENVLLPLLKSYNNFVLKKSGEFSIDKDVNTGISYDYLIPNNNKKYYLLIMKKQLLEQQKTNSKYDILYFFPDQYGNDDLLEKNRSSDFYLEIDSFFDDEFLLEGYLYKSDDKYEYLLTDILVKNKEIVNVSFELRYSLLNEIIQKIGREKLMYLNNHMSINIHPIFDDENQNLVKIFKNNFIYNTFCLEKVCNFNKRRYIDIKIDKQEEKNIEKGKYTDVYNVYNYETNNFEGILYVKGIRESQRMKLLFNDKYTIDNDKYTIDNNTKVKINCIWNQVFSKWQPIFN